MYKPSTTRRRTFTCRRKGSYKLNTICIICIQQNITDYKYVFAAYNIYNSQPQNITRNNKEQIVMVYTYVTCTYIMYIMYIILQQQNIIWNILVQFITRNNKEQIVMAYIFVFIAYNI